MHRFRTVVCAVATLAIAPSAFAQAIPGCCQGPTGGCINVPFEGECRPPLDNVFFPRATCDTATGLCGVAAVCGNGIQETGEFCDDGNLVGGDGCSAVCGVEGAMSPQSELRIDLAAEFGGVSGLVMCSAGALDPNPAAPACVDEIPGHAEGDTFVLTGTRAQSRGAEAYGRARYPGAIGSLSRGIMTAFQGLRRPPTTASATASRIVRYMATYTGTGVPPATIPNDLFVYFGGSLRTGRSSDTVVCSTSCTSVPPQRDDVVASVAARIDIHTVVGTTTVFDASADLGSSPASLTIPLFNQHGPWASHFDVQPSVEGRASVADLLYTEFFPALYSVPVNEIFAIEIVLETAVHVNDPPVRFNVLLAESDFLDTAAIEVRTSVPDIVITAIGTDGAPLPPEDGDGDGLPISTDNCRETANADQADADGDGVGDVCDNCPATSHPGQADSDGDGPGNACDVCPFDANADQQDSDGDGIGDACEALSPFTGYRAKSSKGDTCTDDAPSNAGAMCEREEDCGGDDATAFCMPNKFPKDLRVQLTDQFEAGLFALQKPVALANPAEVSGAAANDPETALRGYQIKRVARACAADAPANPGAACRRELDCGGDKATKHCARTAPHEPRIGVQVVNAFGTLRVDTAAPDRLLAPAAVSLIGPVAAPEASRHRVEFFKCHPVKPSDGESPFEPIRDVAVVDRFQQPTHYDLVKPTRLCNPVDVDDAGLENADERLLCYAVKPASHGPAPLVFVHDAFGRARVTTTKGDELCVPSRTVL